VLLRESYREGKKVRKRTLANLSKLPDAAIDGLQILLKGGVAVESLPTAFNITRSRPHGHVAAVYGTLKNIGLEQLIDSKNSRNRRLVLAMIVARIIDPRSKLATARGIERDTCTSSLGEILGLEGADEDELYQAMDWLLEQQERIEKNLAAQHLTNGSLVLYDVSSSYVEGEKCPLAQYGYNRDRKRGKKQIVFGLLCNGKGCPVAIEVFSGNTADSTTKKLDRIVAATMRKKCRLTGEVEIGLKVGKVLNHYGVGKHFQIDIQSDSFSYERNQDSIENEATLDGLYVIRTSVKPEVLSATETIKTYKSLSQVEQAFRSFKTVDLKVRPIYHYTSPRVKAHIFLCMLAYYVEWHMREKLAPLLFDEDDWEAARAKQVSVVKAVVSSATLAKAKTKRTVDDYPVHSFQTLLADLGTLVKNEVRATIGGEKFVFDKITEPTRVQQKALLLLDVSLFCTQ
jgi:hypothetical protein